jgi:hypothetical protein
VTALEDRTAPAVLTVNSLADGPVSAASSALTLREAVALIDDGGAAADASGNSLAAAKAAQINTASPFGVNDVIQFAPGLFGTAQGQIVLKDGGLLLDRSVAISGPGANLLAVSGNGQGTVLAVAAGVDVRLSGLTVEGGNAGDGSGGGIVNNGTLTLVQSTVSGNTALLGEGGGIANNGTLTLLDSSVSGNAAANDGGLDNTGTLTLIQSSVSGNTAVIGNGGLANYGGTLTLIQSTVSGNKAYGAGGIGNYDNGTATLLDSTVVGNSAMGSGDGGIFNTAAMTLTDSIVSGNTASLVAGGIANGGTLILTNTLVTGNTVVEGNGGGIANSGALSLIDSTVSGNTAAEGIGGGIINSGALALTDTVILGNAAVHRGGIATDSTFTLLDSSVAGNAAAHDGRRFDVADRTPADNTGLFDAEASALTGGADGESAPNASTGGEAAAPTAAGSLSLAGSAFSDASTGAVALNQDAVAGSWAGEGSDGDATPPPDGALAGLPTGASAGVNGGVPTPAVAGDASEVGEAVSGQGQETNAPRNVESPARAWAASPTAPGSNRDEGGAEQVFVRARDVFLDPKQDAQEGWTTADLACLLLLPLFSHGACPAEEPRRSLGCR